MVDVGAVLAGGAGIGVVILAVLTIVQVVGALPTRVERWKVGAVVVSAVAMAGVGVVVTYRAVQGESLTIGLLAVAVVAAGITSWLADDVRGD